MKYKNYHQIYTHWPDIGVCVGQFWKKKTPNGRSFTSGRVRCITEDGYIILDQSPKLTPVYKVSGLQLINFYQLVEPVFIKPYIRVNGTTGLQVFVIEGDKYRVFGELRRGVPK